MKPRQELIRTRLAKLETTFSQRIHSISTDKFLEELLKEKDRQFEALENKLAWTNGELVAYRGSFVVMAIVKMGKVIESVPGFRPLMLFIYRIIQNTIWRKPRVAIAESDTICEPNSNRLRMKELQNLHEGQACYLLLDDSTPVAEALPQLEGHPTICVDKAFHVFLKNKVYPTYYIGADPDELFNHITLLNRFNQCTRLFCHQLKTHISPNGLTYFYSMDWGFRNRKSSYFQSFRYSPDASHVTYAGPSSLSASLQLATYMGFKKVHVIGQHKKDPELEFLHRAMQENGVTLEWKA